MFKHSHLIFPSVTLLLVLLVSMARPMAVYADDGAPPPPATEEPTNPPTEEAPVEVESGSSSSDTSSAPSADTESVAVSEILEAAPEGTQVVVLDEYGIALPLTSEDAAEIVATVDPMWCPAGTLPGGVGCTINFASPQALIDDMDNNNPSTTTSVYEQDGIIYFTADPGGAFILTRGSGAALQNLDYDALKIFNLTLQGGWNGLNDGSGFTLSGQTNFGANRVQIGTSSNPWGGNITINNISIDGASNTGLMVFTAGDINLNYVDSQNNTGDGARLDNDNGTGTVIVQNSSFNGNTNIGLRVLSNENITLTGVTAQDNTNRGADLNNITGSGSINLSSSIFSNNNSRGLDASSTGNITFSNVIAEGNLSSGARLNNTFGSGNISLNSSLFSSNGGYGVEASSNGDITLFNVIANENIRSGARLDNRSGIGSINVGAKIADGALFNGNGIDGLDAYSNGDITIANVTASYNAEIGASLVNDSGEGNIFVSNSTFDSNTSIMGAGQNMGLEIFSGGDVTLDTVSASGNLGANGSSISGSSLLIENSTFNNNEYGLYLEGDEAEVVCSQFNGNNVYGIDGLNVFVTFTLDDVIFSGNGSGDYLGSAFVTSGGCSPSDEGGGEEEEIEEEESEGDGGSSGAGGTSLNIVPVTGLPLHTVPVTGSEQIELDCSAFSGTKLILPNGDSVILPCPIHDQGLLTGQTQDELPGKLDDQFGFLSAMDGEVIRDGQAVSTLDTSMIIDFVIPNDQHNANLAILHWDGSQWVEVPGGHVTADGYFEATTHFTGIFVLVTK